MLRRFILVFSVLVLCFAWGSLLIAETVSLQSRDVTVLYEKERMSKIAREVLDVYPDVKDGLRHMMDRKVAVRPVILIKDGDIFRKVAGNQAIIALALPAQNLIVLDASRVNKEPFALEATLKHELCHLVVYAEAGGASVPRWFDEGVCQWASGGLAELMVIDGDKTLRKAVMSGRLIRLNQLVKFPDDEQSLVLAYEEAKSAVDYLVNKYGRDVIPRILAHLRDGDAMDEAVSKSLSLELTEFEAAWTAHLKRRYSWFYYVSSNLYTILFAGGGLLTCYGFLRLLRKKREYVDEDEVEEEDVHGQEKGP